MNTANRRASWKLDTAGIVVAGRDAIRNNNPAKHIQEPRYTFCSIGTPPVLEGQVMNRYTDLPVLHAAYVLLPEVW